MKSFAAALGFAAIMLGRASPASADILWLKDNNIIECKVEKIEKRRIGQGSPVECYIVKDERGKTLIFPKKEVIGFTPGKTSWELRKENREWYEKEYPNAKDDAKSQREFAKKCADKKRNGDLDDEAEKHFKRAYDLEAPEIKTDPKSLEVFAKRVRDEYGLYDEALAVFRKVLKAKRDEALQKEKLTPEICVGLGKQARDLELFPEAKAHFEEALTLNDKHSTARGELKNLQKQLEVPLNMPIYNAVKGPFSLGIRFLKSRQSPDGSFGSDINEAGVHGLRGMTAMATMALVAEWQFEKFKNLEKATEIPAHLEKALLFLMRPRQDVENPTGGRIEGDDMWGAIFSTEALVMCARERAIMDKHGEAVFKSIKEHLARLKELQRSDGGWYYYNFVRDSSSFSTASTVIILEALKNLNVEVSLCNEMIPPACGLISKMRIGKGTYKYMEMPGYNSSMSPLGASARSPLCEFALYCAEKGDPDDYKQAIMNWFGNVHLLMKIKGQAGTHIGKGMTAPYYFLYSHMYMARAVKIMPKNMSKGMLHRITGMMLSYQEPDFTWSDWTMTKDFKVAQTGLALVTLWHLATGDRDPSVAPLRSGGVINPAGTATEDKKKDGDPKPEGPKEPPKDTPKDDPPKEPPK